MSWLSNFEDSAPAQPALRPQPSRQRSGQPVLGGERTEGSDRRARRHLADAVPAVHRKPRVPARAGFAESAGGSDIRDAKGAGRRPRGVREIHRADQASPALIRTFKARCRSATSPTRSSTYWSRELRWWRFSSTQPMCCLPRSRQGKHRTPRVHFAWSSRPASERPQQH